MIIQENHLDYPSLSDVESMIALGGSSMMGGLNDMLVEEADSEI